MTKEQAAEQWINNPKPNCLYDIGSFFAGWEAREAQFLNDASEFVEWSHENYEHLIVGAGDIRWRKRNIDRPKGYNGKLYTSTELYKIFNPSGATPQDARERDMEFTQLLAEFKTMQNRLKYYEEYPLPAPQAVGPVWVKALSRVPPDSNLVHIRYCTAKTKFKTTGFYDTDKVWYSQGRYPIHWPDTIEWLDESNTQQVFTREDMERAAGAFYMVGFPHQTTPKDWVETNYPNTIK